MKPDGTILGNMMNGEHFKKVLGDGSAFLQTLYVLCFIASLIAFFVGVARLAKSSGNPSERSRALRDILVAGGCFIALGSLGLIFLALVSFGT